ncbi:DUF3502 domain-containing protein [Ruminococcus sp.]|uniref:DUF3502 domain-containing protein n=1 Tax=Ruminococcus sp. TaxID=41978 RepID=UPI0025FA2A3F|nr:DUF3502 domain-containing protein [Ruminococcus sp.]MBQ8966960.1 DUF3502 domain-containing protein [Ruminococcus sp.]
MKKLTILILSIFLLTGCSQSQTEEPSSNDKTENSKNSEKPVTIIVDDTEDEQVDYYLRSYDEKYDYCKENYPNKAVLTWLTDSYERYELELNDYLYNNNYDYVICFKEIDAFSANTPDSTYLDVIENMVNSGENFDILCNFGVCLGADAVSNSYYYLSEKGIYEPLDDYITDEKYSDYYKLLPQKYWDSYKYQGKIYGVDNSYSTLYSDYGIAIYNDLLTESGIDPKTFGQSLSESSQAYKTLYDKTGKSVNFYRSFFTEDILTANYIVSGIAISDGNVINVFEQPETKAYYDILKALADDNYITINSDSDFMASGYDVQDKGTNGEIIRNDNTGITKIYNQINNYICTPTNAIGVYSKSANKDLAVDALLNVVFNKEINNIITFGIEGEQYVLKDGIVEMNDVDENNISSSVDITFNNPLISYQCYQQNDEIISFDYYDLYEEAEYLEDVGFLFDGSNIADTYNNVVSKIMEFNPASDDMDSYLTDFNKQLDEAGLQMVLDEINKQLGEYDEESY